MIVILLTIIAAILLFGGFVGDTTMPICAYESYDATCARAVNFAINHPYMSGEEIARHLAKIEND